MSNKDSLTSNIIRKIKAEIDKRVNAGNVDGDTDLWVLLLVSDMHSRIYGIEKNPAFVLGQWFSEYPRVSWIAFGIVSIVSISSVLAVVAVFLNKMDLTLVASP